MSEENAPPNAGEVRDSATDAAITDPPAVPVSHNSSAGENTAPAESSVEIAAPEPVFETLAAEAVEEASPEPPASGAVEAVLDPTASDTSQGEAAPAPGQPATVEQVVATETPPAPAPPAPTVREVIVEKQVPLTEQEKETIFREKLTGNLTEANKIKHSKHEAHLQEIVDFIRKRGTLVTNQEIEEGLQMPDTTVTRCLNELIRRGLVVRMGDQRHAKYKLTGAV